MSKQYHPVNLFPVPKKESWAGRVAQAAECPPSKREAQSSNPSITTTKHKKKKKKRKKERRKKSLDSR
jgi:hypothetical protein